MMVHQRALRAATARILLVTCALAGTIGCSGDPSGPGGESRIVSVVVAPTQTTLASIGETRELTATATDASGDAVGTEFNWSSSNPVAVVVDDDGRVTALANGTSTIQAEADGVSATATVVVVQVMQSLEVLQGNEQVGGVGQPLDTLVRIRVRDAGGTPAAGIPLHFTTLGGGSVATSVVTTTAEGVAEVEWTLGTTPGINELTVRRQGTNTVLAQLTATAFAESPSSIEILDGNNQTELPGLPLPTPIRVLLVDQYNNPVAGIPVAFSALHAGDVVEPAEALTDLDGIATASWSLGPGLGARAARALVPDSVVFDPTNPPGAVTFHAAAVGFAVTNVTPQTATVGSTITLNGTGFGAGVNDNIVRIDGVIAPVISASPTALAVQVPSFGCAAARPRTIEIVRSNQSASLLVPVNSPSQLDLDVGERVVITDPADFCLQFASAQSGAASYLVGVTSTRALNASAAFAFTGNSPTAPAVVESSGQSSSRATNAVVVQRPGSPEAALREWERSFVATRLGRTTRTRPFSRAGATTTMGAAATAAGAATTAAGRANNVSVGSNATFRVPDITGDPCNTFVSQAATVVHVGEGIVVAVPEIPDALFPVVANHADVVAALAQLQSRVATIRDRATAFIGELASVYDADERLMLLLTPALNNQPVPQAFGAAVDLAEQSVCASSDEQAIVYVTIDDVDYAQPQQAVAALTATLSMSLPEVAHEFTHILQHVNRLAAGLGVTLPAWLAEGQAETLTEVVGRALRGDDAGMDYGASVVNADAVTAAWYRPRFEQLAYLFGWDGANGRVAGAPEQCSVFGFGGLGSVCRPESAPGAAWSFVRFLTDRISQAIPGGEPALHRTLAMSSDIASIDALVETYTGASIAELIVEWAMMLHADGRLTPAAAPALQLRSWNLSSIFASMSPVQRLAPEQRSFDAFTRSGIVVGGGTAYLLLDADNGHDALAVRVRDAFDRVLGNDLHIRLWVVRMQ